MHTTMMIPGSELSPLVSIIEGRLAQDLLCIQCHYNLRGLEQSGRCPECGASVRDTIDVAPVYHSCPPLATYWTTAALVPASVGIAAMFGFRVLLVLNGLRIMDLWNRAQGTLSNPVATRFVTAGMVLATAFFWLGLLGLIYSTGLMVAAIRRRDRRSVVLASISAVASLLYGLLAVQTGLIIAGI